jgi:molybdenum cofactor synthesis domain-containing protein
MARTAGIIIIGDEVLSGKFQDENSPFMAKQLREHGVDLRRISVIPDDIDEIAREVRAFSDLFDCVFTTGGIGPTHDDMTIEAISKGFGVRPVVDGYLRGLLEQKYGTALTPERLKMAQIPEGAELVKDETTFLPAIRIRNVYIFPGIPELLRKKFTAILKHFSDTPLSLRKVYVTEYESEIAPHLNEVVRQFPQVKIGSYPFIDTKDYRVMVTFEALDVELLNQSVESFTSGLSADKIFKVE